MTPASRHLSPDVSVALASASAPPARRMQVTLVTVWEDARGGPPARRMQVTLVTVWEDARGGPPARRTQVTLVTVWHDARGAPLEISLQPITLCASGDRSADRLPAA